MPTVPPPYRITCHPISRGSPEEKRQELNQVLLDLGPEGRKSYNELVQELKKTVVPAVTFVTRPHPLFPENLFFAREVKEESLGRVLGTVTCLQMLIRNIHLGFVYDLIVTEEYRGEGMGQALVEKIVAESELGNQKTVLPLESLVALVPTHSNLGVFLEKCGFKLRNASSKREEYRFKLIALRRDALGKKERVTPIPRNSS